MEAARFGGPGSGPRPGHPYYGPRGAAIPDGGSGPAVSGPQSYKGYELTEVDNPPAKEGSPADVVDAAKDERAAVAAAEPRMTRDMIDLAESHGGTMAGLETRLKSEKSIARKITSEMNEPGNDGDAFKTATGMSDVVRYTMTFKDADYVAGAQGAIRDLADRGYELRVKNFWQPGDPYQGINVAAQDAKSGINFELQFHTPTSLDFKKPQLDPGSPLESQALHKLYEVYRESTNAKERYKLYDQMSRISANIPIPSGRLDAIGTRKFQPFTPLPGSDPVDLRGARKRQGPLP